MTNEELAELERRMADECLVDLPIQVESLRNHAAERKRNGWLKSSHNLAAAANVIEALAPFHNAAPSLIATAREAEALRAENARLRHHWAALDKALANNIIETDQPNRVRWEGEWHYGPMADAYFALLGVVRECARAALEQGEDAILRAERNEPWRLK